MGKKSIRMDESMGIIELNGGFFLKSIPPKHPYRPFLDPPLEPLIWKISHRQASTAAPPQGQQLCAQLPQRGVAGLWSIFNSKVRV